MVRHKVIQYSVPVKSEPGTLFRVTQTLAKEGINVTGVMVQCVGDVSIMRFLSDKENNAVRKPLENAGYEVFETPVFQVELRHQPGELSRLAKCLEDEDITILGIYGTADGAESSRVVVMVDQPEKAQPVLSRLAEKTHAAA